MTEDVTAVVELTPAEVKFLQSATGTRCATCVNAHHPKQCVTCPRHTIEAKLHKAAHGFELALGIDLYDTVD